MNTRQALRQDARRPLVLAATLTMALLVTITTSSDQPWLVNFSDQPWLASSVPAQTASAQASVRRELDVPSTETTRFLDAYANGDEALADSLASPLYRAERARRGLDVGTRLLLRRGNSEPSATSTLEFEYAGGTRTKRGFVRYLYAARSIGPDGPREGSYSAWRLDADPDGRVVWLEMVWLFGPETNAVSWVQDAERLSRVAAPEAAVQAGVHPVAGVASQRTGEGHYLLGADARASAANLKAGHSRALPLATYAVDSDGQLRPGAWTFGYGEQTLSHYGSVRRPSPKIQVESKDRALLQGYLETLG